MKRSRPKGFTLIEVMIAIAILSMALATVFGSNIGAARSTMHARNITRATMMARCRVVEAEAYLVRNQLPIAETDLDDPPSTGDDPCCTDGFTCDAKVELIELPSPASVETAGGDQLLGRAAQGAAGSSFTRAGAPAAPPGDGGAARSDPMGSLAGAMSMMGGGGASSGPSAGGSSLAGAGAPGPREMAGMLLTAVYPSVKPLLEGAIRRLTVTVRWREGSVDHSFDVVEYVTNPGQTLPSGDALNAAQQALTGAAGAAGSVPGTGAPATPRPLSATTPAIPGGAR
ncbi:MAG: prepilin-type N-terminal cleavage/methylation domain-containing protein [Polyangiales bacterium]